MALKLHILESKSVLHWKCVRRILYLKLHWKGPPFGTCSENSFPSWHYTNTQPITATYTTRGCEKRCDPSNTAKRNMCIQSCNTPKYKGHSLGFISLVGVLCIRVYNTHYSKLNFTIQVYTQQYRHIQHNLLPSKRWKYF